MVNAHQGDRISKGSFPPMKLTGKVLHWGHVTVRLPTLYSDLRPPAGWLEVWFAVGVYAVAGFCCLPIWCGQVRLRFLRPSEFRSRPRNSHLALYLYVWFTRCWCGYRRAFRVFVYAHRGPCRFRVFSHVCKQLPVVFGNQAVSVSKLVCKRPARLRGHLRMLYA